MRIAQVTPVYPPYRGGMARVAFEYTERLRRRGHDVRVITPEVRIGNAGLLPSIDGDVFDRDIVHLHYPFYGGAEPLAHARAAGTVRALVVTYHMDATAVGLKGAVFDAHRQAVQPWVLSQADQVLASSADYAAASSVAELARTADRITILPFGVDLDRFTPAAEPVDRAPVVLFVGGLDAAHRFKGTDVLFAALAGLMDVPWRLVMVGDGGDRPRLEREAVQHGLAPRVVFAGDVSDEALPGYYQLADLHVLPSVAPAEAFGLVTLEAAASGLPSLVSDLPGVRTNVRPGETGRIVPPGDVAAWSLALRDLLTAHPMRRELGRRARERAERECGWPGLIDRLEGIYGDVLARL